MSILGDQMDGFEVDVDALDQGIRGVLEPWINHAGLMWGKLKLIEHGDELRIAGHGRDTDSGRDLGMTCGAFAGRYTMTATGLVESLHSYVGALHAFRDTLQQVVDSYRANELRQEDRFRGMLRDS